MPHNITYFEIKVRWSSELYDDSYDKCEVKELSVNGHQLPEPINGKLAEIMSDVLEWEQERNR